MSHYPSAPGFRSRSGALSPPHAIASACPSRYAFPTVGVPRYSPIGPNIDSALLFAIIRQESAFNPADLSSANAMGLMQVTPIAARDTCKRFSCTYDVKRLKNDTPYGSSGSAIRATRRSIP
jgi:soluble lytic murein transglycosylase-like protein